MGLPKGYKFKKPMARKQRENISKAKLGFRPSRKIRDNLSKGQRGRWRRYRWAKRLNGLNPFRGSQ